MMKIVVVVAFLDGGGNRRDKLASLSSTSLGYVKDRNDAASIAIQQRGRKSDTKSEVEIKMTAPC